MARLRSIPCGFVLLSVLQLGFGFAGHGAPVRAVRQRLQRSYEGIKIPKISRHARGALATMSSGAAEGVLCGEAPCVCCSGLPYSECCQPYHDGKAEAPDPLALLRSRYSAYANQKPDYVIATTHPNNPDYRAPSDEKGIEEWRKNIKAFSNLYLFEGLKVRKKKNVAVDSGETGYAAMTFIALLRNRLVPGEQLEFIERSTFLKEKGKWYYVNGDLDFRPATIRKKS